MRILRKMFRSLPFGSGFPLQSLTQNFLNQRIFILTSKVKTSNLKVSFCAAIAVKLKLSVSNKSNCIINANTTYQLQTTSYKPNATTD